MVRYVSFWQGWGGLPMMAYTGETPPKSGTFLRLYFLKRRVRIGLQLEYFEPNIPFGCTNLIDETRKRGFAVSRSPGSCC